jgi:hypothetical protein
MRSLVVWLGFAGVLCAQSISEFGAAAAGGATGAAAGKKASEGITAIFGKVDKQTADAAKQTKPAPATAAAPPDAAPVAAQAATPTVASPPPVSAASVPSPPKPAAKTIRKKTATVDQTVAKTAAKSTGKDDAYNLVPPPPPIRRVAIGKPLETPARLVAAQAPPPVAIPTLPTLVPPQPVTTEDLRRIGPGTNREDLLKLGGFTSRISMVDDGHLAETFRYAAGVVHVSDGVVAAVELR